MLSPLTRRKRATPRVEDAERPEVDRVRGRKGGGPPEPDPAGPLIDRPFLLAMPIGELIRGELARPELLVGLGGPVCSTSIKGGDRGQGWTWQGFKA